MLRAALQIEEERHGLENASTVDTRNRLAIVLQDAGKLDEAEEHFRYVLQAMEKLGGPQHTETVEVLNNLAL